MIQKVLKFILRVAFILCYTQGFSQEMKVPNRKEIKLITNDSTIIAEVLVTQITSSSMNTNKRYYWYKNDRIKSNIGGYHGKLLDGKFQLLKGGNLLLSGNFRNGLKNGSWKRWGEDGRYVELIEWKDGAIHGDYRNFSKDGKQMSFYLYEEGKKHGKYNIWNEEGEQIEKGKYKDGLKHGVVLLYKKGDVVEKQKYHKGEQKIKTPKKVKNQEKTSKSSEEKNWRQLFQKKEKTKPKEKESWIKKTFKKKNVEE